jgi:hypothetical protein
MHVRCRVQRAATDDQAAAAAAGKYNMYSSAQLVQVTSY